METKRKGARTLASISPELKQQLDNGLIETASLPEWLATDQVILAKTILAQAQAMQYCEAIERAVIELKLKTTTKVLPAVGKVLAQQGVLPDTELYNYLANYPNDIVRSWCAYIILNIPEIGFEEALAYMLPFAADAHFSVREVAWMALRPLIERNVTDALSHLQPLVYHQEEGIRRFASEVSRPRGVWCAHIQTLKTNPELAEELLTPLQTDASRYVQNSVANWLNDASKSRPEWVLELCNKWNSNNPNDKATMYITKRALRTVNKK